MQMMLKWTAVVLGACVGLALVLGAVLYRSGGARGVLDGSGVWPRFLASRPDYDALEADRARQRERPPGQPVATATPPPPVVIERATPAAPAETPRRAAATETGAPVRGYWPDFRGLNRDGRYEDTAIQVEWPTDGLRRLWKQPIGLGYASFVVAEGRAFTIEQRRGQEVVAAYDVDTGRELWTHAWDGEFVETMGGDGPRATPTYHGGRVYALGALGELRCLEAGTGALVWRRNILADNDAANLDYGMAAAPLIVDDKVIVLPGGSPGKSVVAYHKTTGEPIWRALDDRQAYTSPMLATLGGVRQLLVVSATRAVGLTVEDGRVLWEYPWTTMMGINAAQPLLLGNDRVFLSASYGQGAAVFEVRNVDGAFGAHSVWHNERMKNRFTSSVLHRGYVYGLDEAILACIDPATGERKWKGGRYGYGQLLVAGDHLIVLTENGEIVLVRATPERHEELARFQAIEGKTWNHPVIVDGRLLVRNMREMAAFDIHSR